MAVAYVLDWYTSKYLLLNDVPQSDFDQLRAGDKLVYQCTDQTGIVGLSVGVFLGHTAPTDRKATFSRLLVGDEKEFFNQQQSFALKIFPLFKKKFKTNFVGSTPVTARFHIFTDQIYFYFYSEERYVFSEFVRELRQTLDKNIFLFQIGARDMVKMSPATDCIVGCNGISLCCKSTRPLPSIEIESVVLQHLEGRDIEKLKGRCGKLKCCLMHELELYVEESKQYPHKGTSVCCTSNKEICGFVTSYNIMTRDVSIRTADGNFFRLPLDQVKQQVQKPTQAPTQK